MYRYGFTALLFLTSTAYAETIPPSPPKWIATAGGSVSVIDGGEAQPSATLSLTRVSKKATIGISGTLTGSDSGNASPGLYPERIATVALTGTRKFGRLIVDANVSAGWAHFQPGTLPVSPTTSIPFTSRADGFGAGGGISTVLHLGRNFTLTPRLGANYSQSQLTRYVADTGSGPSRLANQTDGVTFSASAMLQTPLGKQHQHMVSTFIAINDSADFIHRPGRTDVIQSTTDMADTFVDYGIAASFSLRDRLGLDLSAMRSAGVDGPDSTVVSFDLRLMY